MCVGARARGVSARERCMLQVRTPRRDGVEGQGVRLVPRARAALGAPRLRPAVPDHDSTEGCFPAFPQPQTTYHRPPTPRFFVGTRTTPQRVMRCARAVRGPRACRLRARRVIPRATAPPRRSLPRRVA